VHPNLQVYAIDPKQEYAALINYLGGTAQTLKADTEYGFDSDYAVLVPEDRGDLESVKHMVDGLNQMYSAASRDDRKTLILIDEAKRLLEHEAGRHALNQFVLEARDTNTAITAISQSARHFTDYREGRDILDNMPGKVLMNHDNVTESMRDYFNLSQQEAQKIQGLATGDDASYSESLLKVSDQVDAKVRVQSTEKEHDLITSASEARRTISDPSAASIREP
jgi:type IV secretory pathway VirB4 component